MTAPILKTAGNPTPQRLWTVDVDLAWTGPVMPVTPNWVTAQFVEQVDFNPDDANFQDSTITGDAGYSGQDAMGAAWQATVMFNRMVDPTVNPPDYDPVQEYVRNRAIGRFGGQRVIRCRIYEWDKNDVAGVYTPRKEAYVGNASPTWPGTGGGNQADERKVSSVWNGKGRLMIVAHPYPVTASAPTVTFVSPTSLPTAGGTNVVIQGTGFATTLPTTGVKFAGTNATSWSVISDNEIAATAPAHAAGTGNVVVTNTTGASATGTANQITYA